MQGVCLSPSSTCPISDLYWAFLARHAPLFDGNIRMAMPMRTLQSARKKSEKQMRASTTVVDVLSQGRPLTPRTSRRLGPARRR